MEVAIKYKLLNGELLKGSLLFLSKEYSSYRVMLDYNLLTENIDYYIDGSKLYIKRNLYGSQLIVEDGQTADSITPLLERISLLEEKITTMEESITSIDSIKKTADDITKKQAIVEDNISNIQKEISNNANNINNLTKSIETYSIKLSETNGTLERYKDEIQTELYSISEVFGQKYKALLESIKNVGAQFTTHYNEYASVLSSINKLQEAVNNIQNTQNDNICKDILVKYDNTLKQLDDKITMLNLAIGIETAQRRRIDTEIKMLLAQLIDDVEKIEAVIVGNYDDETAVYEFLEKTKSELNLKINKLARVAVANIIRLFKLKSNIKENVDG